MTPKTATLDTSLFVNFYHIGQSRLFDRLEYSLLTTIHVILELQGFRTDEIRKSFSDQLGVRIFRMPLTLDDLVEMANVPFSKQCSDVELSCFVLAARMGASVLCDDTRAVRFARRYISFPEVVGTAEILIQAYLLNLVGDADLKDFSACLERHKFRLPFDLCYEAAGRRYLTKPSPE